MKIFLNIIYYVIFAVVISVALLLFFPALPFEGNIETKVVVSGSMEPEIKTGSVIVVKPSESYGINDVITFGEDTPTNIPTTHRIINSRVQSGVTYFQTKGDANQDPDSQEVRERDIIGKVWFSIPYLGYLIDFAKQPLGFLIVVIVPAALIILDEIRKIIQEVLRMRRKKQNKHDTNA